MDRSKRLAQLVMSRGMRVFAMGVIGFHVVSCTVPHKPCSVKCGPGAARTKTPPRSDADIVVARLTALGYSLDAARRSVAELTDGELAALADNPEVIKRTGQAEVVVVLLTLVTTAALMDSNGDEVCPDCNGTGMNSNATCSGCDGKGELYTGHLDSKGRPTKVQCSECGGTGHPKCESCGGTGKRGSGSHLQTK